MIFSRTTNISGRNEGKMGLFSLLVEYNPQSVMGYNCNRINTIYGRCRNIMRALERGRIQEFLD